MATDDMIYLASKSPRRQELLNQIARAKALSSAAYTDESWDAMQEVLEEAETVRDTSRDQAEIDALNAQINELRNRKPEVIEKVVEKRVEVPAPAAKTVSVSDLIFVTFAQGKSALTNDAKKALDAVKEGSHVQVVGTASPEGSKEINDRLSQARADVVAKYLKGRGVIVDEATGKGVQGVTSNRLAIVYVK